MKSFNDRAMVQSILDRVARIQPASPRQWGRMSPHQMLCHCCDALRFALGERSVTPDITFLNRTVIKHLALYTPIPWPKGVTTRPEVDQDASGTPPVDFEQDRRELLTLIRRYISERPIPRPAHPIFGNMTEFEWMRWGYMHIDHHLRQFGV
jgi:hypothetical protein